MILNNAVSPYAIGIYSISKNISSLNNGIHAGSRENHKGKSPFSHEVDFKRLHENILASRDILRVVSNGCPNIDPALSSLYSNIEKLKENLFSLTLEKRANGRRGTEISKIQSIIRELQEVESEICEILRVSKIQENFIGDNFKSGPDILDIANKIAPPPIDKIKKKIDLMVYSGAARNHKKNQLLGKKSKLESKINILNKKTEDLKRGNQFEHKKIDIIIKKIEEYKNELLSVCQQLERLKQGELKGEHTRKYLARIGGTEVTMTTNDNVKLNGMLLDCNSFIKKISEGGGRNIHYSYTHRNGSKVNLSGIAFKKSDFENDKNHVIHDLIELKGLMVYNLDNPNVGSGWAVLDDKNELILFNAEEVENITMNKGADQHGLLTMDTSTVHGRFLLRKDLNPALLKREYSEIKHYNKESRPVVIITSGNSGLYEMHKYEALYQLFNGMNVMMFNFRGYGKSEGFPSEEGFHRDMETAYQYVKKGYEINDSNILLQAMCLSGGVAAQLAAKHPKLNIALNQTYGKLRDVNEDVIAGHIDNYDIGNSKHNTTVKPLVKSTKQNLKLISKLANHVLPSFEVTKNLVKNNGKKAILFAKNDDMMKFYHVEKTIKALSEANKANEVTVISGPGTHSDTFLVMQDTPYENTDEGVATSRQIEGIRCKSFNLIRDYNEAGQNIYDELTAQYNRLEKRASQEQNTQKKRIIEGQAQKVEHLATELFNTFALAAQDVEKSTEVHINSLLNQYDETLRKQSFSTRRQFKFFLIRAGLYQPIIDDPTTLKNGTNLEKLKKGHHLLNSFNKYAYNLKNLEASLGNITADSKLESYEKKGNTHLFRIINTDDQFTVSVNHSDFQNFQEMMKEYEALLAEYDSNAEFLKIHLEKEISELTLKIYRTFSQITNLQKTAFTDNKRIFNSIEATTIEKLKHGCYDEYVEAFLKDLNFSDSFNQISTKIDDLLINIQSSVEEAEELYYQAENSTKDFEYMVGHIGNSIFDKQLSTLQINREKSLTRCHELMQKVRTQNMKNYNSLAVIYSVINHASELSDKVDQIKAIVSRNTVSKQELSECLNKLITLKSERCNITDNILNEIDNCSLPYDMIDHLKTEIDDNCVYNIWESVFELIDEISARIR